MTEVRHISNVPAFTREELQAINTLVWTKTVETISHLHTRGEPETDEYSRENLKRLYDIRRKITAHAQKTQSIQSFNKEPHVNI